MSTIFFFSNIDFPNGDASSAHAALTVKGLRANGDNVFLIIPHASLLGNWAGNERGKGHQNGVPFLYLLGRTNRAVGAVRATVESLHGMIQAGLLVRRWVRRGKLDAVILATPDAFEYFPLILACRIFRVPIIVSMVEMMTFSKDARGWRQKLRMAGYAYSEKRLPRFAAGYIAISTALMKYYEQLLPKERLLLSPILVDPENTSGAGDRRGDCMTILHGGTFGEKDGVPYLLKAFAAVRAAIPNTRLILTGKSPNNAIMDSLRTIVRSLGIEDVVEFTGFVSRSELERIKQEAHVLLVCRTRSAFAQYGFPWKLGEYAMTGKPVVATKVGDIESVFTDRESIFLAEPENPDSIAKTLIEVLNNYKNAQAVGARGKDMALTRLNYLTETKRISSFIENTILNRMEERIGR